MKFSMTVLLLLAVLSFKASAEETLTEETPQEDSAGAPPQIYATPTLLFAPNPGEIWAEISLRGVQQLENSEDSSAVLTDLNKTQMQFNTRIVGSLGGVFFGGINLLYTSSSSTTDTTTAGVEATTHASTSAVSDPTFNIGTRFNNPGISSVANFSFSIPGIQSNTFGSSTTTRTKNTNITWTPSFNVFTNDVSKSLLALGISYEFTSGSHVDKTTKAGAETITDIQGGNRSSLTGTWEKPLGENAFGIEMTYSFVEPTRHFSGLTETDDDEQTFLTGEIYYKINLDENFYIFPSASYQKMLGSVQNGSEVFRDDTYQVAISGRCVF